MLPSAKQSESVGHPRKINKKHLGVSAYEVHVATSIRGAFEKSPLEEDREAHLDEGSEEEDEGEVEDHAPLVAVVAGPFDHLLDCDRCLGTRL